MSNNLGKYKCKRKKAESKAVYSVCILSMYKLHKGLLHIIKTTPYILLKWINHYKNPVWKKTENKPWKKPSKNKTVIIFEW